MANKSSSNHNFKSRWMTEPLTIIYYFSLYIMELISLFIKSIKRKRRSVLTMMIVPIIAIIISANTEGSHRQIIQNIEIAARWYVGWVMLGIASSIGLGTGLHTFMLFLGPFVARTTITAAQCGNLDFDTQGSQSFMCHSSDKIGMDISIWEIANKVKWDCLAWGIGTAIGELPPYFMARAAIEAGKDDGDITSFERILVKSPSDRTLSEKAQIWIHNLLKTAGFFGILLCASIPNPLFDLAGIMCGHFGVPFMTFFGATLIGKAFIKTSIQCILLITIFSKSVLEKILIHLFEFAPGLHGLLSSAIEDSAQKFTDSRAAAAQQDSGSGWISKVWNGFLLIMVLYFILSIIESLSLSHMKKTKKS